MKDKPDAHAGKMGRAKAGGTIMATAFAKRIGELLKTGKVSRTRKQEARLKDIRQRATKDRGVGEIETP